MMSQGIFSSPPLQVHLSWQRQDDGTYLGDPMLATLRRMKKKRARFVVEKRARQHWLLFDRKPNALAMVFKTLGEAQNAAKKRVRADAVEASRDRDREQALGNAYEYVKSLEDRIEELERNMANLETE